MKSDRNKWEYWFFANKIRVECTFGRYSPIEYKLPFLLSRRILMNIYLWPNMVIPCSLMSWTKSEDFWFFRKSNINNSKILQNSKIVFYSQYQNSYLKYAKLVFIFAYVRFKVKLRLTGVMFLLHKWFRWILIFPTDSFEFMFSFQCDYVVAEDVRTMVAPVEMECVYRSAVMRKILSSMVFTIYLPNTESG